MASEKRYTAYYVILQVGLETEKLANTWRGGACLPVLSLEGQGQRVVALNSDWTIL